ncbi:MAG: anthranilate synthase component I, partial [Myxococcales bacterium]|nr:anthranilate synthase component I [Myxococcales bacterium]
MTPSSSTDSPQIHRRTLVVDGITPVGAYAALRSNAGEGSFLLESVVPGERWGRYSILGYRPRRVITLFGESGVDPYERLKELAPTGMADDADVAERFARAYVGLIPYDIVHFATKVAPWPGDPPVVARLLAEATVIVFDNLTHTATIAAHSQADLELAVTELSRVPALTPLSPPDPTQIPEDLDVDTSDAGYGETVDKVKEYIRAGDAFQVVP